MKGFAQTYGLDRNRNGGGVMIYIRDDIPSKPLVKHVFSTLKDYTKRHACRTAGPTLAASHSRNVASLSFFYMYYFGRCSSELVELVSLACCRGRFTPYSDSFNDFSVTVRRCYKDFYATVSFLAQPATLWNSLLAEYFPLTYDINSVKSRLL